MTTKRRSQLILFLTFIIGLAVPFIGFLFPDFFLGTKEQINAFLAPFGNKSWLVFLLLSVIPVVFTPLNHSVFGLVGGLLYGVVWGTVLNWSAKVVGHVVNFAIGRKLGRPFLHRILGNETLEDYDRLFEGKQHILVLIYGVPFLTNDMLAYFAGGSQVTFRRYLILAGLGHVGTALSLALVGAGLDGNRTYLIAGSVVIVGYLAAYLILRKHKQQTPITEKGKDH